MGEEFYLAVPDLKRRFWLGKHYPAESSIGSDESSILEDFYRLLKHANEEYDEEVGDGVPLKELTTAHIAEYHKMYSEAILLDEKLPVVLFVERMKKYFPKASVVSDYGEEMEKFRDYEIVDFEEDYNKAKSKIEKLRKIKK